MIKSWHFKFVLLIVYSVLALPTIVAAAEDSSRVSWEAVLINWLPMLFLIVVWIYFMKKNSGKWQTWSSDEMKQHLEKIEQSLERIAKALEKK